MRARIYATSAERQKAYRARHGGELQPTAPTVPRKSKRPPSRAARLTTITESLRLLQGEYESWLASMPESLSESRLAERLQETIDQLEGAIELVCEIQPPRPFQSE
jgi:hypothetical protein